MAGKSTAVTAPKVNKSTEIKRARQSEYEPLTDEKIREILSRIEHGVPLTRACREVNVSRSSFRVAVMKREDVGATYAKSLELLAQAQVEQIEQAIDDMRNGVIDAQMARVEIDARKWFASKFLPKTYGDKLDLTSDGKALPQPLLGGVTIEPNKELPETT